MLKNVAGQFLYVEAWSSATGAEVAGDAGNITAYIEKDGGGAVQTNDVNPTEVDATNMPGVYRFTLTQAETNCNNGILKAKSATANVRIGAIAFAPVPLPNALLFVPGTVDTTYHAATTTTFECDDIVEATADHYRRRVVIFTSGALAGQAVAISAYELTGDGVGKFTVSEMTEAPANDDTFYIV